MSNQFIALNVAEKPRIAKQVSEILSNNNYTNMQSASKYNPIHTFNYTVKN